MLRVSRLQLPVGPDYAITAYSSQGLTLDSAIVDLCFDERTDTATAYVALSRVRTRNDILIMQSFSLHLFQKGIPIGPKLLLKKLRGEDIADDIAEHLAVCRPASRNPWLRFVWQAERAKQAQADIDEAERQKERGKQRKGATKAKKKDREKRHLDKETPEQKEARLKAKKDRQKRVREEETPEQKEARLKQRRKRAHEKETQ